MEHKRSKITIRNVSRTFPAADGKCVNALENINFEIEDAYSSAGRDIGEFRVLLGPSGCGKSTLLRLIAGLDRADSGEVLVNEAPVSGPGKDRGMVFQKYTSFPWLTVAGNIAYGLKINGVPGERAKETVAQLIQEIGLSGFENAYPETLSGGMQQRVAIARTLALRPSVILMDEPFGALDAQTRSEMQQLLLKVWDETASTILFVTHDVEEAIYLADRIFIMSAHPGTIVEDVQVPFDRPRDLGLKQRNEFHDLQNYVLGRLAESSRERAGAGECLNASSPIPRISKVTQLGQHDQLCQGCVSLAVQLDFAGRRGGLCCHQRHGFADLACRGTGADVPGDRSAKLTLPATGAVRGTRGRAVETSAEAQRDAAEPVSGNAKPVRSLRADLWIDSHELCAALLAVADLPAADRH